VKRVELSAYGKLPLSKEFLRLRCFRGPAGSYRRWVDEGYQEATRRGGDQPHRLGHAHHLLFYPEGEKTAVVARLRDSTDSGGERPFPFTCYGSCPAKLLKAPPGEALARVRPLFEELTRLDESVQGLADLAAFQEELAHQSLPPPLERGPGEAAESQRLDELVFAGESEPKPESWVERLWTLRHACETLKAGRIPGARLPGLRVPLAAKADPLGQSVLWLRMLDNAGFLAGRRTPVSLLFSASEEPGSLWVLIRPPRTEDFSMLGTAPGELLGPPPPGHSSPPVAGRSVFREAVQGELLAKGATLASLAGFPLFAAC